MEKRRFSVGKSWIVENMKLFRDGRFALVALPKAVEAALGVTEDDMENISSFPRNIQGVCMAATIRETKDGVKLSVRATPEYDATVIAAAFGGGGHKLAAGVTLNMPLNEAIAVLEKAFEDGMNEQ